jgi:pimeloyl-ACP methyl ester carboxylesterase
VLNSPTVDDAHRTMLGEIGRLIVDIPRERWPLIALNALDYLRAGVRRSLETLRHAIDDPIEEHVRRVRAPILIVRGSRDPIVSEAWVRHLTSIAPNASRVTIDGAPHAANFSAPDAFARAVREFRGVVFGPYDQVG